MKIERGNTRDVFVGKKYVFKIPSTLEWRLFLHGLLANMIERRMIGRHPNLAKIKYANRFGFLIIMERAAEVKNIDWGLFQRFIQRKFKDDELFDFLWSDCRPDNWGYKDGTLVKIDYGG